MTDSQFDNLVAGDQIYVNYGYRRFCYFVILHKRGKEVWAVQVANPKDRFKGQQLWSHRREYNVEHSRYRVPLTYKNHPAYKAYPDPDFELMP